MVPGRFFIFVWFALMLAMATPITAPAEQQNQIDRVELAPNLPEPYCMRDWKAVATGYDQLAFDLNTQGEHLPLLPLRLPLAGSSSSRSPDSDSNSSSASAAPMIGHQHRLAHGDRSSRLLTSLAVELS